MPERPNIYLDNPDPLSSVLSKLQLSAEVYVNGEFCGDWAVDTSGNRRIPFHLIGKGEAWLHFEGKEPQQLKTGSLIIFPHDSSHIISSSVKKPASKTVNAPLISTGSNITNMICGFFDFNNKAVLPLLDSLDSVLIVDIEKKAHNSTVPAVKTLLHLLLMELKREAAGFYAAINQLAYLLFIEIIRLQILEKKVDKGLISAMFDPKISLSLAAIHNAPEKQWTLESLANESIMGRSSFAQRFSELVGVTPMQYLTNWRMLEATKLLSEKASMPVSDVAELCGYRSSIAFQKAFKNNMGITPAVYRKQNKT